MRLNSPSLGVHILQACAREAGFNVSVLYANLSLAASIGLNNYQCISEVPSAEMLGERFFAASAYGLPLLGYDLTENLFESNQPNELIGFNFAKLKELATLADAWAETVAASLANRNFRVVGCTSMFEQTAASVSLLRKIKRFDPQIVTIIGGPNCEGEMARGIAALSDAIDYVFSGESEVTFPELLQQVRTGQLRGNRIIEGEACLNLDALPLPDFSDYFEQLDYFLPALTPLNRNVELPYETSRGCWWGEKHHCTFCGLNGQGMAFRQKKPDKVIDDLQNLLARHPTPWVTMVDNIMPFSYFKTLIPRLSDEIPVRHDDIPNTDKFDGRCSG